MTFAPAATPKADEWSNEGITFTDKDFAVIAELAMRDFGLHLTIAKRDLVYSRLRKRLRQLGMQSFGAYCDRLNGPNGAEERVTMLSALTTNVTHFFREEHHFKLLRETALPPLLRAAKSGGRVRIWSAGCSAGQEPYSLAFTVLSLLPEAASLNVRILATDVDGEILARAEAGIYPNEELKAIPDALHRFTQTHDAKNFRIADAPRKLIKFGKLNLIETWPVKGPFDVIFCRNVAIYFDKPTQARLWARFAELLTPGSHLCIGHSERVAGPAEKMLKAVGVTAYQRSPAGANTTTLTPIRQEGPGL